MFGFQALPVASHSPTVTDTVPSLVSHSTRGAEVYPEPRSNTRRRLLTDDIYYTTLAQGGGKVRTAECASKTLRMRKMVPVAI